MGFSGIVGVSYTPTGQKGGFWGRGDGGCLRYFIMIVLLMAIVFSFLYFLDSKNELKTKILNANSHYKRGVNMFDVGDYNGALYEYSKAIEIYPEYPSAYSNRSNVKTQIKDYNGAINDINEAIKLKPDVADYYYNRANINSDLGNQKLALLDYDKAIFLDSTKSNYFYNRGSTKMEINDKMGAISDLNRVIKLDSNNFEALYHRATVKMILKDYFGAIADYTVLINRCDNPSLCIYEYYYRGKTYLDIGDFTSACSDFKVLIDGDYQHELAYDAIELFENNCVKKLVNNKK